MNTYDENLHSNIMFAQQNRELELKQRESQLDASAFALYFAQGAGITATDKFASSSQKYIQNKEMHGQAVKCNSLSTNVVNTANQQKQNTAASISSTAVAAANIQVATNAIIRLASDADSIFSIVNAADFGSDIYAEAVMVRAMINETAFDAEVAAQYALEASAMIAEVPANSNADKAKSTNTSIGTLLAATTSDLAASAAMLETDNSAIAAANVAVDLAVGKMSSDSVAFMGAKNAFEFLNMQLNLNLKAVPHEGAADYYDVSFSRYVFEFANPGPATVNNAKNLVSPVEDYNIMLVKDRKKALFTLSDAMELLQDPQRYVVVKNPAAHPGNEILRRITVTELADSDGEFIRPGARYAVVVLARLTNIYKKTINNFDDFLSAPSAVFSLKQALAKATVTVPVLPDGKLTFSVDTALREIAVQYRCLFLHYSTLPFIFNLKLAENVPQGNYVPYDLQGEVTAQPIAAQPGTTDNFGNPLIEGESYKLAVLSFYDGPEAGRDAYANALSDWENTPAFTFSHATNNNK